MRRTASSTTGQGAPQPPRDAGTESDKSPLRRSRSRSSLGVPPRLSRSTAVAAKARARSSATSSALPGAGGDCPLLA
ncbi:hypothetical protein BE21_38330 [Sorangium cellulosum]|uniref:Uncharacterized protein n=1 Tax=Sorangium cellulosum TaxID=56 RepID=A0A150TMD4_SORCE|nr:hypothetical protein BE21_38330 [Sorangium cellulosum]